jgi:hypothetical protein
MESEVKSGDFRTSIAANMWALDHDGREPPEENYNLNNWLFQLQYGEQLFEMGDLSINGTELIGSTISHRGAHLALDVVDTKAEAFTVRSNENTGFSHMLGFKDPHQRLTGGGIEREVLPDGMLTLRGMYIYGKNQDPHDYNAETLEGGSEGYVYSLGATSRWFEEKINVDGEYSEGRFDENVWDAIGSEDDRAWRVKVSGTLSPFTYEAGYTYLGRDYHSVVNPTGTFDRKEFNMSGGLQFETWSMDVSFLHNKDNIAEDPLFPVMENIFGDFNINVFIPDWPIFNLNLSVSDQVSNRDPIGFTPIDNFTITGGGGFSYIAETWNITSNYNYTYFDDEQFISDNDTWTHTVMVSGEWRLFEWFSLSPSVSYTHLETKIEPLVTHTYQGSLGTRFTFTDYLDLSLTFSLLDNQSNDDSMHARTYGVTGQFNWHLDDLFYSDMSKTLSVRGQYNRNEDRVALTRTEEYTMEFVMSVGLPVSFGE